VKARRRLGPGVTVDVALPGGQQVNVGRVDLGSGARPAALDGGSGAVIEAMARERAPARRGGER
jgi:hypothetical protein